MYTYILTDHVFFFCATDLYLCTCMYVDVHTFKYKERQTLGNWAGSTRSEADLLTEKSPSFEVMVKISSPSDSRPVGESGNMVRIDGSEATSDVNLVYRSSTRSQSPAR